MASSALKNVFSPSTIHKHTHTHTQAVEAADQGAATRKKGNKKRNRQLGRWTPGPCFGRQWGISVCVYEYVCVCVCMCVSHGHWALVAAG
jgi:hypothetical protein